jgi:hypothetical protein
LYAVPRTFLHYFQLLSCCCLHCRLLLLLLLLLPLLLGVANLVYL